MFAGLEGAKKAVGVKRKPRKLELDEAEAEFW